MKKLLIILMSILTIGCSEEEGINIPPGMECDRNPKGWDGWRKYEECISREYLYIYKCDKQQAKFIIDCAKAANPMSGGKGEDLVYQCWKTSDRLYCKKEFINLN